MLRYFSYGNLKCELIVWIYPELLFCKLDNKLHTFNITIKHIIKKNAILSSFL